MCKITIHQIENLPHLSLFAKFAKADKIILADTFRFKKNYFENRNKIRTKDGWQWITVPVEKDNHKPINEVHIIYKSNWQKEYLNALRCNYSRTPYFDTIYPFIVSIIAYGYENISDLNEILIRLILTFLDINIPIIKTSELNLDKNLSSTDLLIEICKKTNATSYISGSSGRDYLEIDKFKQNNIELEFHDYLHPVYKQRFEPFIPEMSILDLLFNYGDKTKDAIKGKGIASLEIILKKYNYKNMKILEMFGGKGEGHLSCYGKKHNDLTIWELDESNFNILCKSYPNATKVQCNSLERINLDYNHYDMLIIDPPATISMKELLPQALNLLNSDGIVIFRAIKQPYTVLSNSTTVLPDRTLEEWDGILGKEYIIKNRYEQPREYYHDTLWLSDYVYELRRK